jgi:hypothetical protein
MAAGSSASGASGATEAERAQRSTPWGARVNRVCRFTGGIRDRFGRNARADVLLHYGDISREGIEFRQERVTSLPRRGQLLHRVRRRDGRQGRGQLPRRARVNRAASGTLPRARRGEGGVRLDPTRALVRVLTLSVV